MGYVCPIDKFYSTTNAGMCTHIMNIASTEHQEWVASNGINYNDLVLTGNSAPLKALVEKKCKV